MSSSCVPGGVDDGLFWGLPIIRDTAVTEDEVTTPLSKLRCPEQFGRNGEFVPFSSADLVQCLRREVKSGFAFTRERRCTTTVSSAVYGGAHGAQAISPPPSSQSPPPVAWNSRCSSPHSHLPSDIRGTRDNSAWSWRASAAGGPEPPAPPPPRTSAASVCGIQQPVPQRWRSPIMNGGRSLAHSPQHSPRHSPHAGIRNHAPGERLARAMSNLASRSPTSSVSPHAVPQYTVPHANSRYNFPLSPARAASRGECQGRTSPKSAAPLPKQVENSGGYLGGTCASASASSSTSAGQSAAIVAQGPNPTNLPGRVAGTGHWRGTCNTSAPRRANFPCVSPSGGAIGSTSWPRQSSPTVGVGAAPPPSTRTGVANCRTAPHSPPPCCVSPRRGVPADAPRGSSSAGCRGASHDSRSPRAPASPDDSRSPSGGPLPHRSAPSRHPQRRVPYPAPPFNPVTDHDLLFELPRDVPWVRFEAVVGLADSSSDIWAGGRAKFLLIDEDTQIVRWESSDAFEPWSPTELCSVHFGSTCPVSAAHNTYTETDGDASVCARNSRPHASTSNQASQAPMRKICLRVSCPFPPDGALWMDPVVTAQADRTAGLKGCIQRHYPGGDCNVLRSSTSGDIADRESGKQPLEPKLWGEIVLCELAIETVAYLQVRELARLLCVCFVDQFLQQQLWHLVFFHCFKPSYMRHFHRPLQGQPRPSALPQAIPGSPGPSPSAAPCQFGLVQGSVDSVHAGSGPGLTNLGSNQRARVNPRRGQQSPRQRIRTSRQSGGGSDRTGHAAAHPATSPGSPVFRHSPNSLFGGAWTGSAAGGIWVAGSAWTSFVPAWALDAFDWRQICRRFHLAQLLCLSVNFQTFNGMTPAGFIKDSGETLRYSAKSGGVGQHSHAGAFSSAPRCGWNVPLGVDSFSSRPPAAVVAHRSPLGVSGMPPNVATVRGTAGPEPLATTPAVSERDSSVILPFGPAVACQIRPQWNLEVEPGIYLVAATVGDRHVGFNASLEVGGQQVFDNDWIEAGTFRSRCLLCVASRGVISVGPHWPYRTDDCAPSSPLGAMPGETSFMPAEQVRSPRVGEVGIRHESPRSLSPTPALSPTSGVASGLSPSRASREVSARGTRLVSLRVVSAALSREVAREKCWTLAELSGRVSEAKCRVEEVLDARTRLLAQSTSIADCASSLNVLDRELMRAHGKYADLHVQKVLKLCSLIAMIRRVTHPYIYLNGEAFSSPPVGQSLHGHVEF